MSRPLHAVVAIGALSLMSARALTADCPGGYPPPPPYVGPAYEPPFYGGPGGQADPTGRVPVPPEPSGGTTKPGGTTPSIHPGGVTPGGRPGARVARGTTPGARRGRTADVFNWQSWWWNNQHLFLDFSKDESASTGGSDFFLGARDRRNVAPSDPVTNRVVADRIVPALLKALESRDDDTRAVAVRALGRIGEGVPIESVVRCLKDKSGEVRRCAVLALGEAEAASHLTDLVRLALDEGESTTLRGYALVSIGLVGDEAGVGVLRRVVLADGPSLDLRVTALAALSLVPGPGTRDLVRHLAADVKADENLRALATEAIGRLCGDDDAATLLLRLTDDRSPQVRRSAVIALSQVEPGSQRIGDALARVLRDDRDLPARAFAAIALGEHGSPPARKALLRAFDESSPAALRSFAAIGLGLLRDPSGTKALREALDDGCGDPSLAAAVALALGLANDHTSGRALGAIVADSSSHPMVRGYAAVALGLVGDRSLLPTLEKALMADAPPSLLDPLVKAVGLMGVGSGARLFTEALAAAGSDARRAALIEAVGHLRDHSFVDPFLALLANSAVSDRIRVFAAIALGRIGDRHRTPVLSALTNRRNYLVPTPTIDSLVSLL